MALELTGLPSQCAFTATVYRTGYRANDASSAYIGKGSPKDLTVAQVAQLNGLTRDLPERTWTGRSDAKGMLSLTIPMNSNDIVLVTVQAAVVVERNLFNSAGLPAPTFSSQAVDVRPY